MLGRYIVCCYESLQSSMKLIFITCSDTRALVMFQYIPDIRLSG